VNNANESSADAIFRRAADQAGISRRGLFPVGVALWRQAGIAGKDRR
jgi:hypothetical protein